MAVMVQTAIDEIGAPSFPSRTGEAERLKVRAFELFADQDLTLREVAKLVGCSHQYLYKLAKAYQWEERKAKRRALRLVEDTALQDEALSVARATLQERLPQRLAELEKLCSGKPNLKAILAWCHMAGLTGKPAEPTEPRPPGKIEVFNDLSDNRSVTVVRDSPTIAPDAISTGSVGLLISALEPEVLPESPVIPNV